jgi:hypothetical protein
MHGSAVGVQGLEAETLRRSEGSHVPPAVRFVPQETRRKLEG